MRETLEQTMSNDEINAINKEVAIEMAKDERDNIDGGLIATKQLDQDEAALTQ